MKDPVKIIQNTLESKICKINEAIKNSGLAEKTVTIETKFPKRCNNCQKLFRTLNGFTKRTKPVSHYFVHLMPEFKKIGEYRNCTCGSTLCVLYKDLRDQKAMTEVHDQVFNELKNQIITELVCSENVADQLMDKAKIRI